MNPKENFVKPCHNMDAFSFAVSVGGGINMPEYSTQPPPSSETGFNNEQNPMGNASEHINETNHLSMANTNSRSHHDKPPSSEGSSGGVSNTCSSRYSLPHSTSSFESLTKQFTNFQNMALNSSLQKALYEMYSMSALCQSGTSGDNENRNCEARNSVLEAILEIECCNIPLRQEVIDSLLNSEDSTYSKPLNYQEYTNIESNPTLHKLEQERLEELKNACIILRNPYKRVVDKTEQLVDAVKVTENAIRRLIKMSKRLSSFNRLDQNDQISLLKGSVIEMMCIRATTNFNHETNFWYFIDDTKQGLNMVSMDVLKNANWINYLSHKNFAIKFNSQFKNPIIADLLTVIILFRPSRATTSNQELIRDEFLNYCYLLKRYLYVNSNGDKCKAKSDYIGVMHRLEELYYLAEDIVRIYLDMNPENAGPLFVELFDLK